MLVTLGFLSLRYRNPRLLNFIHSVHYVQQSTGSSFFLFPMITKRYIKKLVLNRTSLTCMQQSNKIGLKKVAKRLICLRLPRAFRVDISQLVIETIITTPLFLELTQSIGTIDNYIQDYSYVVLSTILRYPYNYRYRVNWAGR